MKNSLLTFIFFFTSILWSKSMLGNPFLPEHSLNKKKDYLLKKVKEKLRKYTPTQIDISYGESPRKLIKNVLIYYNGYYEVSFISGEDGLKYNCDLNHGHSHKGSAQEGNAEIYLMNCKNENDSALFPTHLERIFREQHPKKANSAPMKFRNYTAFNTAMDIFLLDQWYYSVEYTNFKQQRMRCKAFLAYKKTWTSMVDQAMHIDDCEEIDFPKITSSNNMQEVDIDPKCNDSNILNGIKINDNLSLSDNLNLSNNLFDFYAKELNKRWPLPKESEVNCQERDISYWEKFSKKMISLDSIKLKTLKKKKSINHFVEVSNQMTKSKNQKLERIVLENALINQAYNRLFLKFREKNQGYNYLQWLSIAAHSSPIVGRSLRQAYSPNVSENFLIANSGLREIQEQDKKKSHNIGKITKFFEKRPDVAIMAGKGNKDVYNDMFWQNFAATYCGPQKLVQLNNDLAKKYKKKDNKKLSRHHEHLSNSWQLILNGISKRPIDKELIRLGNLQLLKIEQNNILQGQMYEGFESKIVNKIGIFNSLATAKFYDTNDKKLMTFDEFSKITKQENNLSNFNSRFNWMEYIATEQVNYINKAEQKGALKLLYTPSLHESYLLLNDYK